MKVKKHKKKSVKRLYFFMKRNINMIYISQKRETFQSAFKAEFDYFINLNSWFSDKFEKFKNLQIIVLSLVQFSSGFFTFLPIFPCPVRNNICLLLDQSRWNMDTGQRWLRGYNKD